MAVESGINPATSRTVVHEMPRYACWTDTTRSTIIAPAASIVATTAGTTPVASRTHHRGQDEDGSRESGAHRNRLPADEIGGIDDEQLPVVGDLVQRAPVALDEQHVADLQHRGGGAAVLSPVAARQARGGDR